MAGNLWDQLLAWAQEAPLWLERILTIAFFFFVAWVVYRLAPRLARRGARLQRTGAASARTRPERLATLSGLISSAITVLAFVVAVVLSLSLFVDNNTLIWVIGLFSAAFGLGARNLVNDFVSGVSLIFADDYAVGEKVEVVGIEGVVEAVNVRTTLLRAPTGELFVVPNGDVRLIRNFSRGRFSTVTVVVKIGGAQVGRALPLLEALGKEAVALLPNLLEPWQVISEMGVIGQTTELKLVAKARFGAAAEMRPRLLALLHERLSEAEIELES
ncbi:MAG TPA: mechanosensitive ion channel family protein [Anaerolineae bacterium]|nr:mechanosensitive ion channel family protein [Anaerolineae bacterium]HNU04133.1 mechanosensitive ion channel family protein [Anaerolineae bacterium]